jgi:hypothetical protein
MREPFHTFRASFLRVFLWLSACVYATFLIIGLGVVVVHFVDTGTLFVPPRMLSNDLPDLIGFAALQIANVLVVTAAIIWALAIYVNADGMGYRNSLLRYREVEWSAVTSVRRFNLLGLTFLLVSAANVPSPIWLPLFLARPLQFQQAVWLYAGPDNPVTRDITRGPT